MSILNPQSIVLSICGANSLFTIHFLHSEPDSNPYHQFWRLRCCHYIIGVVFLLIHQGLNLNNKSQSLVCCQLHHESIL